MTLKRLQQQALNEKKWRSEAKRDYESISKSIAQSASNSYTLTQMKSAAMLIITAIVNDLTKMKS